MIGEASIVGLVKTSLIIIGVFVVLKFIGQIMLAKRNISEQNQLDKQREDLRKEKLYYEANKGKVNILNQKHSEKVQDVDFEEVK